MAESIGTTKRTAESSSEAANSAEEEDDGWVGPLPSEAAKPKKRKGKMDVEKLILEVEKRPVLYGIRGQVYDNRNKREKSWKEVAKILNESVGECKRRWKNIRDAYKKDQKEKDKDVKSGTGAKKHKTAYVYSDMLNFLLPSLQIKEEGGSQLMPQSRHSNLLDDYDSVYSQDSSDEPDKVENVVGQLDLHNIETVPSSALSDTSFTTPSSSQQTLNGTKSHMDSFQEQLLLILKEKVTQPLPVSASVDADEQFLLSFVPSMRTIPPQRKAKLKIEISQLMYEALYPEDSRTSGVLQYEQVYLDNLPQAEYYEKSYMHRDVITHIAVTKTDFIITASCDGHVKFWKKQEEGIEFVKHFRSHLGNIQDISVNSSGTLLCTISNDKSMKVFDIVNFDMINMMKVSYVPQCCEWIHSPGDPIRALAVSEADSNKIHVYDGQGTNQPMDTLERLHTKPVTMMKYNPVYEVMVSVDKARMLEYWSGPKYDYRFPKNIRFDSKLDSDLFEFAKKKVNPTSLSFSHDGKKFAALSSDRKVRIFNFETGKLSRVFDESLQHSTEVQQMKQVLPNMEFGRRMAGERDLEKSEALNLGNIVFDESGNFVLYSTMLGVKLVNLHTNRCMRMLGKAENLRLLQIALFQGKVKKTKAAVTVEMEASENPTLESVSVDPTLFCTAYKKNRVYLFTRREPEDTKSVDTERDVFNEKPSKEDIISATESSGAQRLYDNATIHTTMGDVGVKLFLKECPRSVENFCVHSKAGYYNGHIFHRIIKGFMIQTGDPSGTGTGGESIWGGEFEDEFHPNLRHDRPYTLSMANAGPNTNGSQFFVTVIPTPWLDNKHTVFGRVVKGMEVVQNISNVKTNPKTDKPYDDIQILSITVK